MFLAQTIPCASLGFLSSFDALFKFSNGSSNAKTIDPIVEVNKMRHSLAMLESHILYNQRHQPPSTSSHPHSSPLASSSRPSFDFSASAAADLSSSRFSPPVEHINEAMKQEVIEDVHLDSSMADINPPGKTGRSDQAGFYTGATSTVSHLTSVSI